MSYTVKVQISSCTVWTLTLIRLRFECLRLMETLICTILIHCKTMKSHLMTSNRSMLTVAQAYVNYFLDHYSVDIFKCGLSMARSLEGLVL